ncbi:hypothetical protein CN140_33450 [Sinorhizobium meliloti]|uniref:hypothetical protein n=1 Tax=Rhizobium meliloti TaxID=382 RepID=UPI00037EFA57|nr:hypothetical protein [Sinorhizobium meliloti]RVL72543.1 hypothetical protein CN140_33450 [Sinorhizobium meliloti]
MHGNVTTLDVSKFICATDELARRSGLSITMGEDFGEYVRITSKLPGKRPTYPNFCPDCSDLLPGKAFWIVGRDREGTVAHVQAMRVDDLSDTNLAEHLESLKSCFKDPGLKAGQYSSCRCYAPSARGITGIVAYRGDLWLREDFRGRGLMSFIGHIAFGLAWAKWAPDFIYSLVADWYVAKGVLGRSGYVNREQHGSVLRLDAEGIDDDDWLLWMTRDQVLQMISSTLETENR